jgi:hypothetical protein
MSRSDRRPSRRRSLVPLALAAGLLGTLAGAPARAQDSGGAAVTGETLFGSYQLEARGTGVQARYEIQGLLPGGAPVLDLTIPETLARFGSGPAGYGLASLAYPGGIIVNLGSLVSQSGADGSSIPPYPIKAEAFYPAGPTEVLAAQGGGTQSVRSNELGVDALGAFPGLDASPVVAVGSITSASRTTIEDGKAVSRTRVALDDVSILGGVVAIDALVTDLVAAHDGANGDAAGSTTATGVRFLGLDASLTEDGLVLKEAPAVEGAGAPLGTLLDPVLGPLQDLTAPVRQLLAPVLQQAVPSLNGVLGAAGIQVRVINDDEVTSESGAAGHASSGLALDFSYKGKEQAALSQLIESIPPDLRPNVGPLPNPIAFLTENHITGLTLGNGTVSALASQPFPTLDTPVGDLPGGEFTGGDLAPSFGDLAPSFSTPIPALTPGGRVPLEDAVPTSTTTAATTALLLLLVLASPLFGVASTRLADSVLVPAATACPSGLDQPPTPPRPS